jgi:hypothetical protein
MTHGAQYRIGRIPVKMTVRGPFRRRRRAEAPQQEDRDPSLAAGVRMAFGDFQNESGLIIVSPRGGDGSLQRLVNEKEISRWRNLMKAERAVPSD